MTSNSDELNEYEVVFYNRHSRMESERVTGIRALNPMEAERAAWREFDSRHTKEQFVRRNDYTISVKGPGQ